MNKMILIFMLFAHNACALNGQETFLQANKQYEEKHFEKALGLYSSIEKKGAVIWYNMGNCHYQLGHEVDALACWKRAENGASRALLRDIEYNIDAVMYEQKGTSQESLLNKLMKLINHISTLLIQIIFLIVWIGFILAIRLSKHSKKYKVASFVLSALMLPLATLVGFKYVHQQEAVAFARMDAKLFAGPNEKYHVIGDVTEKSQLRVCAKDGNWYKIAHQKQIGWMNSNDLIVL